MTRKQKISRNQRGRWEGSGIRPDRLDDRLAMLSADVDIVGWIRMPEHQKQLYRFRATQAMSIFTEHTDGQ